MVGVNREHPDLVAESPVTVFSQQDWIILFVVKGSVNGVSTKIIVVKIVTVFRIIVLVKLVSQNAKNRHTNKYALFIEIETTASKRGTKMYIHKKFNSW